MRAILLQFALLPSLRLRLWNRRGYARPQEAIIIPEHHRHGMVVEVTPDTMLNLQLCPRHWMRRGYARHPVISIIVAWLSRLRPTPCHTNPYVIYTSHLCCLHQRRQWNSPLLSSGSFSSRGQQPAGNPTRRLNQQLRSCYALSSVNHSREVATSSQLQFKKSCTADLALPRCDSEPCSFRIGSP